MGHEALPIRLSLPDGFLSPETRCGYEISGKMKRIWAVELDLLNRFQEVCIRNGIKYVALWGTALGAVRHNGFIPWDDDIDVGMDRENYIKFCNVAEREFEHPYFFQNPYTDRRHFSPVARLRNSNTTAVIKGFDSINYNNGIYLDIDVLDGLAMSRMEWRFQNFLKHLALFPLKNQFPCYRFWIDSYIRVRSLYNNRSNHLGISYTFLESEWKAWLSRKDIICSVPMRFEFLDIPVPNDWRGYLERTYGDWEMFPEKEERGAWHRNQVMFDPDTAYFDTLKRKQGI